MRLSKYQKIIYKHNDIWNIYQISIGSSIAGKNNHERAIFYS